MPKPRTENTVRLMIHLSPQTREALDRIATRRDENKSQVIRDLIRDEARRLRLAESGTPTNQEGGE